MQSTSIALLTTEGVLTFTFKPPLTGPQYTDLMEIVNAIGRDEKTVPAIKTWAAQWKVEVIVDHHDHNQGPRKIPRQFSVAGA